MFCDSCGMTENIIWKSSAGGKMLPICDDCGGLLKKVKG